MNYGELMAELKKGKVNHVYLLAGDESYFIDKAQKRLLASLNCSSNEVQTISEGTSVSGIRAAIEQVPFFYPKNVLVVEAGKFLKNQSQSKDAGDKKAEKKTSAGQSDEAELVQLLEDVPEFSYIIFVYNGKADKRRKLYKAVAKTGRVMDAEPVKSYNVGDWLQGKLQEINKDMDRRAYDYFTAAVSSMEPVRLGFLDKELDKLALFMGKEQRQITKDILLQAFSDMPEISGFAMINAIGEKKAARAIELFRRQLENGVYFVLIIGLLAWRVRLLWKVQALQQQGLSGRALESQLKQPPGIAARTVREAQSYPPGLLQKALLSLSDADYGLKTGQADIGELENIIIALSTRRD